jgi:hypothetical protein
MDVFILGCVGTPWRVERLRQMEEAEFRLEVRG